MLEDFLGHGASRLLMATMCISMTKLEIFTALLPALERNAGMLIPQKNSGSFPTLLEWQALLLWKAICCWLLSAVATQVIRIILLSVSGK